MGLDLRAAWVLQPGPHARRAPWGGPGQGQQAEQGRQPTVVGTAIPGYLMTAFATERTLAVLALGLAVLATVSGGPAA